MCCYRKLISLGVVTVTLCFISKCVSLVAVFGEGKFNFKIMTDPVDLMKFVQHLRDSNRKVSAACGGGVGWCGGWGYFNSLTFNTGNKTLFLLPEQKSSGEKREKPGFLTGGGGGAGGGEEEKGRGGGGR